MGLTMAKGEAVAFLDAERFASVASGAVELASAAPDIALEGVAQASTAVLEFLGEILSGL